MAAVADGSFEHVTVGRSFAGRVPVPQPGTTLSTLLAPGEVRPMTPSPLAGRASMASVWTGLELLVWGGETAERTFGDGAAYDPVADSWRTLAPSPLSPRNAPAAVWTGDRMILWGGHGEGSDNRDGAAYDPATDTWTPIADAPFSSAGGPVAVWTGEEMLVLAGFNSVAAASYDPDADTWRSIDPVAGQPIGGRSSITWTGDHLVVVATSTFGTVGQSAIYAYGVDEGRWQELPATRSEGVGRSNVVTWSGERLLWIRQEAGAPVRSIIVGESGWTGLASWPDDAAVMDTSVTMDEALRSIDGMRIEPWSRRRGHGLEASQLAPLLAPLAEVSERAGTVGAAEREVVAHGRSERVHLG